jgi:hypothetical protein
MHKYPPFYINNDGVAYLSFVIGYVYWIGYLYKQFSELNNIYNIAQMSKSIKLRNPEVFDYFTNSARLAKPFYL